MLARAVVRTLAVVVLLAFGLSLLVPSLAARVEAPLTRLARFGPSDRGEGFWSGLVVGAGLGFVYAPCAGPILAAVVSVSATTGATGELVAVALGYAAGSAAVLLVLAYGGRRLLDKLRAAGRGPAVQRVLGVVMIVTVNVVTSPRITPSGRRRPPLPVAASSAGNTGSTHGVSAVPAPATIANRTSRNTAPNHG